MSVVRFGDTALQVGDTIRTCCRLRTGIDIGVEEDAIFVEAIPELEGRDSIVCERVGDGLRPGIGCKTYRLTGGFQAKKTRRTVVPIPGDYPLFFEHNHAVRTF